MTTRRFKSIVLNPIFPTLTDLSSLDSELDRLATLGQTRVLIALPNGTASATVASILSTCAATATRSAFKVGFTMPAANSYSGGVWNIAEYTTALVPHTANARFFHCFIIDEPWSAGYTTAQVKQLYTQLKAVLPGQTLGVGFSKQIVSGGYGGNSAMQYEAGMCDVAMIGSMDTDEADGPTTIANTHTVARPIIYAATPSVELWTNLRVFHSTAARLPGLNDVRAALDVLGRTDIEAMMPLTRIWWQKWKAGSAEDNAAVLRDAGAFRLRNLLFARTMAET